MAYTFRFLTAGKQADLKAKINAQASAVPVVTDDLLRAWEMDLLAHQEMAKWPNKPVADKKRHADAILALEAELTKPR